MNPGIEPQWRVLDAHVETIVTGFGLVREPGPVHPLGGAVNGVVRVPTKIGDVVFRVHRPWTTAERLEGIHRIQDRVRRAGLPVPPILASPRGQTWVRLDDRLVEAMPFAGEGHEADFEEEFARSFAMLGRLHRALAEISPAGLPAPAFASYVEPIAALALLAETDDAFRAGAGLEGFPEAAAVREQVRRLYDVLQRERAARARPLPVSLIHGDFLGNNVLHAERGVLAILDFDRMAARERVVDVATSLSCAVSRLERMERRPTALVEDRLRQIGRWLRAYEAEAPAPLASDEIGALPYEMARVQLFPAAHAGRLAAAGQPELAIAQTRSVAWHLPRARWLAANADRLHGALGR